MDGTGGRKTLTKDTNMLDDLTSNVNLDTAREHIEALTGSPDTPMWFRVFADAGDAQADKLFGTVDQLWPALQQHQVAGCGVYLVVNAGGNSGPEITSVRALFVDRDDGAPVPDEWHAEPDFIVRTSAGKWHAYWRVADMPPSEFKTAQQQLAAHYGTDPKVCDLSRVLRLAGTLHLKDPANPQRVTVEALAPSWGRPRPWSGIVAGLPPVQRKAEQEPRRAAPDVELETPCRVALVQMIASLAGPATNLGPKGGGGSDEATRNLANALLDISSPATVADAMANEWMPRCLGGPWDAEFIVEKVERLARDAGKGDTRQSDVGCMSDDRVNDLLLMLVDDPDYGPPQEPIHHSWVPPHVAELLAKLSLSGWLNRDIKPQDFLIGEIQSTTSRTMLYAPTGLGKTNFSMAMAMHLAAGRDFLRWRIPAPRTVLYIDGEMPDVLAKERLVDAAKRLGAEPDRFFYFNTVDFPDMPPLNAEVDGAYPGQQFVEDKIAFFIQNVTGRPIDLIVFDNIQALTLGNLRETDTWSVVRPWTQRLSARHIGQIWVHHTGSNEAKAYGDSTVQWQLDTVLRLERVKNERTDISFNLDFSGKCRLRTPRNRADYTDALVTLVDEKWTIATAVNTELSRSEVGAALVNLGAKAGSSAAYDPKAGTGGVITRELAKSIFRARGNGAEPDATDVDLMVKRLTKRAETDLAAYVARQGAQGSSRLWALLDGIE
jgi:hypothetical protein